MLRPGALGDTLLAVPALRALRRQFGPLTLAAHGGAARLLAALGEVAHGLAFDDPSLGWLFSGAEEPPAEAIVAWLNPAGVPGLQNAAAGGAPGRPRTLLVASSRPEGNESCAQYLVNTLAPLGVDPFLDEHPLSVPPMPSGDILIHPGSGAAAKNWPAQRFAQTIAALERPVRLIVGEADADAALVVEECLGHSLPRLTNLPLGELAAHLAGCHAYLGNDSGVSHLAGLCGARTIVLFGPTSPWIWRPLGPDVHVIEFDAPTERVISVLQESMSS